MSLPSDMASACCYMMRAASSNQFVAGRHADRSPLARLQLFTREIVRDRFRRVPQWASVRACPQVDHTRRPSPRRAFMRRFCLDPGPYGCTKGYLRNNTVLYCTYTTYTMCSVHRARAGPADAPPGGSGVRGGGAARAGRAPGAGARAPTAQGRQGGLGTRRLEPTIVSNRSGMSSPSARSSRSSRGMRAEPCARTNTPARKRKRATRLDANRPITYVECALCRACDMHIRRPRRRRMRARADS